MTTTVTDRKIPAVAAVLGGLLANGAGHSFLLIVLPPLGQSIGFGDVRTGVLAIAALTAAGTSAVWFCIGDPVRADARAGD